ncbi:uncharacterized protein FOMMEDRAFT_159648 [Fomitiporia mediterranea MF3/22]|uniref:uncharacterized protein n=1 Tax=Fomitiporia mediterranea (strain MF3/22) TaxID=694068 RepID=UPI000440798F|nr:uncharacterized protein FOMMEDRAFT_159648 [Fomitiporia mediterranea MF3/22]EJD00053.1 hypothetical protein FOMMEDRAFT_159648 [Fomitiporia mediterranea MF3/22]
MVGLSTDSRNTGFSEKRSGERRNKAVLVEIVIMVADEMAEWYNGARQRVRQAELPVGILGQDA